MRKKITLVLEALESQYFFLFRTEALISSTKVSIENLRFLEGFFIKKLVTLIPASYFDSLKFPEDAVDFDFSRYSNSISSIITSLIYSIKVSIKKLEFREGELIDK